MKIKLNASRQPAETFLIFCPSHLPRAGAATEVTTQTGVNQLTSPCVVQDTLIVAQVFSGSHPAVRKTYNKSHIYN